MAFIDDGGDRWNAGPGRSIEDPCRVVQYCAVKGSGKTLSVLAHLYHWLKNDRMAHVYACIPCYRSESSGSYTWLQLYPDRVTVCENFDYLPQFLAMIKGRQKPLADVRDAAKTPELRAKADANFPPVCLFIDDATVAAKSISADPMFLEIATMSRHWKIHCMLCLHGIRGVASSTVRSNTDRYSIGAQSNVKQVVAFYEEFGGLYTKIWANERAFLAWFEAEICDQKYNMLSINTIAREVAVTKDSKIIADFVRAIPELERQYWAMRARPKPKPAPAAAKRALPPTAVRPRGSMIAMPDLSMRAKR